MFKLSTFAFLSLHPQVLTAGSELGSVWRGDRGLGTKGGMAKSAACSAVISGVRMVKSEGHVIDSRVCVFNSEGGMSNPRGCTALCTVS